MRQTRTVSIYTAYLCYGASVRHRYVNKNTAIGSTYEYKFVFQLLIVSVGAIDRDKSIHLHTRSADSRVLTFAVTYRVATILCSY